MENFKSLGLPESLMHCLEHMNFKVPTPIQAETIPLALQGKDILGSAQTGTGKTAAFGIPLVSYLLNSPTGSAVVLLPTRELATQVLDTLKKLLGRKSVIKSALLIGGEPMPRQLRDLHAKPRLIVGTPGRVNDHLERGTLKLDHTKFLVLDETDRMLDMGFSVQLERIVKCLPKNRQTLMFSATMADSIVKMAQKYLNDPVRISVGSTTAPIEKIKQIIINTTDAEKYDCLEKQLGLVHGSFVVFVKTKFATEKLAKKLRETGHTADAINGDLRQNKRDNVIKHFRNGKNRILVATDVAARGLDIPHIECVVNFDLPQCPEDYIHRIGRTGRAGAEGTAVNLITPADRGRWRDICRLIDPNFIDDSRPSPANKNKKNGGVRRRGPGEGNAHKPRAEGRFSHPKSHRGGSEFKRSASSKTAARENNGESYAPPKKKNPPREEGRSKRSGGFKDAAIRKSFAKPSNERRPAKRSFAS